MFVKLTSADEMAKRVTTSNLKTWTKQFGDELARPLRKKQFAREFLSFETMMDALFLTANIDSKYRIRVPLVA